ncbi:MAG TPA: hypothetical protein VGN80_02845 [Devosiaceae bacterium]|jgi:hypothetical protein|nr:hypothetical protein [Devosiaceae bacterium]
MSKRNIFIAVAAVLVIAVAILMYFWVLEAPTERNLEGLGTELDDAGEPVMVPGPDDPPPPELTPTPDPQ